MSACLRSISLAVLLVGGLVAPAGAADIFPFPVQQKSLGNGLQVLAVPYDSPGTLAFVILVRTGSRDEVEEGHSGFAHFFEHMMFQGTERYSGEEYNDITKRMGADTNAFTSDDRTQYYIIGPSAELETMMDIESDRFKNLKYGKEDFRREALAVLGEYNKNISNPFLPMYERMRELAFTEHTYGHTTMGYLEDIKAMPDYYDYSLSFFDRYYRPENCTVLVVGDVEAGNVFTLAEKYFGDWKKGYTAPAYPVEPAQKQAHRAHIEWASPISPHLMIGYRTPAFSDTAVDTATLDVISQLLFSESAPLFQKLMVEEQWVDSIFGSYQDHRDPYLFMVFGRAKSAELVDKVLATMDEHIARLQSEPVDKERLERIKSHLRYQFALGLDSPGAVASTLSGFLSMTGDPATVNRVYQQYAKVTPEDIQRIARQVFQPKNQTLVTLAHAPKSADDSAAEGR